MDIIRLINKETDEFELLLVKDKDKAMKELETIKKMTINSEDKIKHAIHIGLGVVKAIDSVEIIDMAIDYFI